MTRYKYLILAILLSLSSGVHAITLREAFSRAYNNSEKLKMAQEEFMSEIERMPQAISKFLPTILATVAAEDNKFTSISGLQGVPKGSQKISDVQRNIQIRQNLFNGGGDVAGIKAAQSAYRSSRAKLYQAEQKMLLDSLEDYMSFYEAKEIYAIREATVAFSAKQLQAVEERFNLGEETRTSVAEAKAKFSKSEADKSTAYANLEAAKAKFSKTFAIDSDNITLPEVPSDLPDSLESLILKSSVSNFVVQQVKHDVAASKAASLSAKSNLLPTADFSATLGTKYYNPEVRATEEDGYRQNTNTRSFSTSVTLTIPILSNGGAEYSRIRTANSAARRAAHQLDEILNAVKAQAIGSWYGYDAAKFTIISSDEAVEAYTLALEGVNHEYNVGSKTILEVLEVEERLHNVKIQSVQAKKSLITSAYSMKESVGEMTAVALKLPVKYFNPGTEFRKVKAKVIGF